MKLETSLKSVALAVMMASASMANAADTDWGTVTPGSIFETSFSGQHIGAFEDNYTFSLLTAGSGDLWRSVTLSFGPTFNALSGFTGLTYGLYTAANTFIAATTDLSGTLFQYSSLAAGSYYLQVTGSGWKTDSTRPPTPDPIYNGFISIAAATATPTSSVPEPQTYAMFLAGLGIVGTVIRRRSRSF